MSGGPVQRPWRLVAAAGLLAAGICGCAQRVSTPHRTPMRIPVFAPAPRAAARPEPDHHEQRVTLGASLGGLPLTLSIFGGTGPAIFIMAGIHGDEPNSVAVAHGLLAHLRRHPNVYSGCTIGILPVANPDGLARRRRTNANRVDLNRNFPARNWRSAPGRQVSHGARPGSEPETRAIRNAVDLLNPTVIVSIHAISRGRSCNNYDGPARELAVLMSRHNGYPATGSIGYPTPGSFGSWAGIDQQIPTITLELPQGASGWHCLETNRAALLAVIDAVRTHAASR